MSAPNQSRITDAIVTLRETGGRIDVSLTPDDLGRLTLKLDQTVQGLQITFTADRLDTQDIMRRHIEVLQQQLTNSGFENLSMSFEHNQQEQNDDAELKGSASVDVETQPHIESTNELRVSTISAGLDIRI